MRHELVWAVGGQQGEGIESTGEIAALALHRRGYHIFGFRHFASRIKGGHTHYRLRIGTERVLTPGDEMHILIALDQESVDHNLPDLATGAVLIHDDSFAPKLPADHGLTVLAVPMYRTAQELGFGLMKNMVAAGVTAAVLGQPPDLFRALIAERFRGKGQDLADSNLTAFDKGFQFATEQFGAVGALAAPPDASGVAALDQGGVAALDLGGAAALDEGATARGQRLLLSGNEAMALGALAAGCRIQSAYPITPATEIMYSLIARLPKVGGVVVQAEDEIAAVNMAIGANYAGVRAFTSTSGPGLSLMQEAIGLSGMTEVPLVVIDVQRGGPSTGLPTKTEQSDLNLLVYGGHGEFPRIVLAAGTPEDCFLLTAEAFNLADIYQCPVFVVSDLVLGMCKQSAGPFRADALPIDRGRLVADPRALHDKPPFPRYALTDDGISPRTIPGQPGGWHLETSDEHTEDGTITDKPDIRIRQMDKRMRKLAHFRMNEAPLYYAGPEAPDLLLVGWGGTFGAICEAQQALAEAGHSVAHLHVRLLWPLPAAAIRAHTDVAAAVLICEQNATGQLAGLLRREAGLGDEHHLLTRYDGQPLRPRDVRTKAEEVLAWPRQQQGQK